MSLDEWFALGIPDDVADEAQQWVSRLDSDQVSAEDRQAFLDWLDCSPLNRWAYSELSESWAKLSILQEVSHLIDRSKVLEFPAATMPAPELIPYREKVAWHSIAALLLITFGILLSTLMPNTNGLQSIASDQLKVVELQDGSQLTLNANTLVTTQLSNKAREIWLHRGDVIVKVTHDERPLIVHAQNIDITAIGTEFLVSSRSTGPDVSVLEGAVQMTLSEDSPQPLWDFDRASFFNNKPDSLLLSAGESGRVDAGQSRLIKNAPADVKRKISWRDGLLIFANTDLSEAIDQVMRHSNMKINLKHPALAELTVSGIFNAGDTEEFLSAIHQQLPVEAIRYSSNWVVVRARQ